MLRMQPVLAHVRPRTAASNRRRRMVWTPSVPTIPEAGMSRCIEVVVCIGCSGRMLEIICAECTGGPAQQKTQADYFAWVISCDTALRKYAYQRAQESRYPPETCASRRPIP